MKSIFLSFCSILVMSIAFAQSDMMVQGTAPGLYLLHKVQPKENWYSVGRIYNISPKELAPFNAASLDKPLGIGQQLKIPLTAINFSQDGNKETDEVFVPVYHIIKEKEWMYRISVNYNKVPIDVLEKWNSIPHGQAKAGMKLVVGYLKVKSNQSPLASKGTNKIVASAPVAVATVPKTEEKPQETKQEVKEEKKQEAPPVEKKEPPAVKNDPPKQEVKQVVNAADSKGGGYFKSQYGDNGKSTVGSAGVFKSTSGWNDGKFYALVNNVPVGTIVKINNPSNGKYIYAKVLGSLPDMKESAGLTARISDAAAAELGAEGGKFAVSLIF